MHGLQVNEPIRTDALIIGAGPVGLFQVFQLGLWGVHAHVVDALPYAGGQCAALYADKPIYDVPALPACTGLELTQRLLKQIEPFEPVFHFCQVIQTLQPQAGGEFELQTAQGRIFFAKTVFIAGGVGAFLPRSLDVAGLDDLVGHCVFVGGDVSALWRDHQPPLSVVVVGNDDAALASALEASEHGHRVTLVYRRDQFSASPSLLAQWSAARLARRVHFIAGQVVGFRAQKTSMSHLLVRASEGPIHEIAADRVHVCLGLTPQWGMMEQWGLSTTRKQLNVQPSGMQTSVPGIYAVGDICSYEGKKKLIVCGFHEATQAAHAAAAYLNPDNAKRPLRYTTSNTELRRLLKLQ